MPRGRHVDFLVHAKEGAALTPRTLTEAATAAAAKQAIVDVVSIDGDILATSSRVRTTDTGQELLVGWSHPCGTVSINKIPGNAINRLVAYHLDDGAAD